MEMLAEAPESLNLLTIIDDCKELIFEHLGWIDLINVADTSKHLHAAACRVFHRKYGGSDARVDFGFSFEDA